MKRTKEKKKREKPQSERIEFERGESAKKKSDCGVKKGQGEIYFPKSFGIVSAS